MVAAAAAPRYAPADPTLPKPWRGLVDGSTGYLYFWNPETNVTQYERPVVSQPQLPTPENSTTSVAISSSVQVQQQSSGQHRNSTEEDGLDNNASQTHQQQGFRVTSGTSIAYNHGNSMQSSRASARVQGSSDMGGGLSVETYRRQHEITIMGNNIPAPFMTFESTGFPSDILKEVHQAGFSLPTPIQAQSWPIALQNRDIVAVAKTGSGKTLGYLIPGFIHLQRVRNNSKMGPTVLVLAPTRELATQIQDEAAKFGRSSRISCTCVYGGAPKGPQLRDLDRGTDVVVATPGRLNDILEMRRVSLGQVSYLVLDEADRMLDMGFEPQIRKIVKDIPDRRQTLMFTATWPKEVRKIAADLLVNPAQVNIGSINELVANKSITQYIEMIEPMGKQRRLDQILRSQEPGSKIIIFCSTKRMCDQLARNLSHQFGAAAIHGDKSQSERDHVLSQFRTGRSPILVATDVAARGLDIKDIKAVINYDFPTGVEDYVHRIGRTGRAGATGVSYTFFCDQDAKYASDLIKVLEGANQRVPPEIRSMASRGGFGRAFNRWGCGSGGGRSYCSGRSDSGYGGMGGRGPQSSFGGSESGRRGYGESDQDRYGRDYGEHARGSYVDKDTGCYGEGKTGDADVGLESNKSIGRRGTNHSRSRSRSRSCSPSRSLNRYEGGVLGGGSVPKRDHEVLVNGGSNYAAHSSPSHHQQQQQRSPHDGTGGFGHHSLSPQMDRSSSPNCDGGDYREEGISQLSPLHQGGEEEDGMIPSEPDKNSPRD